MIPDLHRKKLKARTLRVLKVQHVPGLSVGNIDVVPHLCYRRKGRVHAGLSGPAEFSLSVSSCGGQESLQRGVSADAGKFLVWRALSPIESWRSDFFSNFG